MAEEQKASLVGYARDALIEAVGRAQNRVWLASPYVTRGVAEEIARAAGRSQGAEMRLFTELTERSVRPGFSIQRVSWPSARWGSRSST